MQKRDGKENGLPDTSYAVKDPEQLAQNMVSLVNVSTRALSRWLDDKREDNPQKIANEWNEAGNIIGKVMTAWANAPEKFAERQTKLTEELIDLWGRTNRRFMGETVVPLVKPAPGDGRFRDPEWTENPFFDFCKQAYLLSTNWAEEMIKDAQGVDESVRRRAYLYLNQITSALSPSNFPVTNPEVLRMTLTSNAENLVSGMSQLLNDLESSGELLKIRQTDLSAFSVGKNLAVTPGKVMFRNEVVELIQYSPTTPTTFEIPLLIIPPWINKYYILDLVPKKSFIGWLVNQGFTVFVVSWINPTEQLSNKTFEDYMHEGVLQPLDWVLQLTGQEKANVLGYCVGGTLLGTTLAYMAAKGDTRFSSASFLATQLDFTKAGDLLAFIDDEQLEVLEKTMDEYGYLDGARMSAVFNMLRPKDLIWPYVVNNYLLGKQPFPFDLLYWNSDTTRMSPANHRFYLREYYQANKLAKGELEIGGVKLDLGKVTLPVYELATREDHIAPAESVLIGARLFGGPVRYVLAGSGHIAGVINPPASDKYSHWVPGDLDLQTSSSVKDWLEKATEVTGSWWPDYAHWLAHQSGERIDAREPGGEDVEPICDAPGTYVKG